MPVFSHSPRQVILGTVLTIEPKLNKGLRTRYELYSRLTRQSVTLRESPLVSAPMPKAVVVGSLQIPPCGDFRLSGRLSSGGGSRPLTFKWALYREEGSSHVNLLSTVEQGRQELSIDVARLTGSAHSVSLTVSNFVGKSATTANLTLHGSRSFAPLVDILDGQYRADDLVVLEGRATVPECSSASSYSLTHAWTVNPALGQSMSGNTTSVFLSANTLDSSQTYTTKVSVSTVRAASSPVLSDDTFPIALGDGSIQAAVNGGEKRQVSQSSDIVLDACSSTDSDGGVVGQRPATIAWNCTDLQSGQPCVDARSGASLQLAADSCALSLSSGVFATNSTQQFAVTVAKGTRKSTATVDVTVVSGQVPDVEIFAPVFSKYLSRREFIGLEATVRSAEAATLRWDCINNYTGKKPMISEVFVPRQIMPQQHTYCVLHVRSRAYLSALPTNPPECDRTV